MYCDKCYFPCHNRLEGSFSCVSLHSSRVISTPQISLPRIEVPLVRPVSSCSNQSITSINSHQSSVTSLFTPIRVPPFMGKSPRLSNKKKVRAKQKRLSTKKFSQLKQKRTCVKCGSLITVRNTTRHLEVCRGPPPVLYKCNLCGRVLRNSVGYHNHYTACKQKVLIIFLF